MDATTSSTFPVGLNGLESSLASSAGIESIVTTGSVVPTRLHYRWAPKPKMLVTENPRRSLLWYLTDWMLSTPSMVSSFFNGRPNDAFFHGMTHHEGQSMGAITTPSIQVALGHEEEAIRTPEDLSPRGMLVRTTDFGLNAHDNDQPFDTNRVRNTND